MRGRVADGAAFDSCSAQVTLGGQRPRDVRQQGDIRRSRLAIGMGGEEGGCGRTLVWVADARARVSVASQRCVADAEARGAWATASGSCSRCLGVVDGTIRCAS